MQMHFPEILSQAVKHATTVALCHKPYGFLAGSVLCIKQQSSYILWKDTTKIVWLHNKSSSNSSLIPNEATFHETSIDFITPHVLNNTFYVDERRLMS